MLISLLMFDLALIKALINELTLLFLMFLLYLMSSITLLIASPLIGYLLSSISIQLLPLCAINTFIILR